MVQLKCRVFCFCANGSILLGFFHVLRFERGVLALWLQTFEISHRVQCDEREVSFGSHVGLFREAMMFSNGCVYSSKKESESSFLNVVLPGIVQPLKVGLHVKNAKN